MVLADILSQVLSPEAVNAPGQPDVRKFLASHEPSEGLFGIPAAFQGQNLYGFILGHQRLKSRLVCSIHQFVHLSISLEYTLQLTSLFGSRDEIATRMFSDVERFCGRGTARYTLG